MNVLVGCEESGKVREAFIRRGHVAYSNDLIPARDGGAHLQMCVTKAIISQQWDIIILHPECTAMSLSGNRWYGRGMPMHNKRIDAIAYTKRLWALAKKHARIGCALENPTSVLWKELGEPQ